MSAHDQMRKMLDELMGTARNGDGDSETRVPYTDRSICRSFLVGCCPHEVLSATRMDLGECRKTHNLALRADFEKAQKDQDHFYDLDALDDLERFFDDCDRKMEMSKKRLAETQEELSEEASEKANAVLEINEQIGKTLAEAERLGNEGRVDESLQLMEKVEELKKKKHEADLEYRNSMPASSYQQQKLRVCEVCSSYLGVYDNDRRLADHFGGKLHMGFVFLRDKLEELRTAAPERRAQKEALRNRERANRSSDRDRRTESSSDRRRDRGRDSKDRDRRRDRSRSRDRDRSSRDTRTHGGRDGGGSSSRHRDSESSRDHRHKKERRERSRSPAGKKQDRATYKGTARSRDVSLESGERASDDERT